MQVIKVIESWGFRAVAALVFFFLQFHRDLSPGHYPLSRFVHSLHVALYLLIGDRAFHIKTQEQKKKC